MSDAPAAVQSKDGTLNELREHAGDGTLAVVAGAATLFLAGHASERNRFWAGAGAVVGAALTWYGVRKRLAFDGGRDGRSDGRVPDGDETATDVG